MSNKLKQKLEDVGGLDGILDYFRSRSDSYEVKQIKIKAKKAVKLPIRLPWKKSARAEFKLKKKALENDEIMDRGGDLMRIKFAEKYRPAMVGVGYPSRGLIYANLDIARGTEDREVLTRTPSGNPLTYKPLNAKIPGPVSDGEFKDYCAKLGIGVYKKDEDDTTQEDPMAGLDLTAFDLYWEDIKIERDVLIRELRHMPLKSKVELSYLSLFEKSMHHLARSCFYSPYYTHIRCLDVIHIFLWLLNRRNLPLVFHIKVMQCLSLLVYSSPVFKKELVEVGGVRILVKIMQLGMVYSGLQASWATYCLTVASIGSSEVILELKDVNDIDERVGEMTFHMFWYHWPTNFGMILQSILYGPGGVANSLDAFEFL